MAFGAEVWISQSGAASLSCEQEEMADLQDSTWCVFRFSMVVLLQIQILAIHLRSCFAETDCEHARGKIDGLARGMHAHRFLPRSLDRSLPMTCSCSECSLLLHVPKLCRGMR